MEKFSPKVQSKQNDKMMSDSSLAKPAGAYSQGFENKTLSYVERCDARMAKDAAKIRNNSYKGRYS